MTADAPSTFDDMYAQIEQLGATTFHVADAAALVAQMRTDIAAAVASAPKPTKALTFYHELDNTFYSVTSNTFIGQVYALFGLKNIADGAQALMDGRGDMLNGGAGCDPVRGASEMLPRAALKAPRASCTRCPVRAFAVA